MNRLKIVKFKGGLGNQLFQYAFMKYLEHCCGFENVKADFSYFEHLKDDHIRTLRVQSLVGDIKQATKTEISQECLFCQKASSKTILYKAQILIEALLNKKYLLEQERPFLNPSRFEKYTYFDGYWQSWKYVAPIKDVIRTEINQYATVSDKTRSTINAVNKSNSVFVGVRRGDYLASDKARRHYGELTSLYFSHAIDFISKRLSDPVFYVFSNDIEWACKNLNFGQNFVFRRKEEQVSDVEELMLMSSCNHAIISNSTFHWWGAWLIDNPRKCIVSPKLWFADRARIEIQPEEWIKI